MAIMGISLFSMLVILLNTGVILNSWLYSISVLYISIGIELMDGFMIMGPISMGISLVVIIICTFLFLIDFSITVNSPWMIERRMKDISIDSAMENIVRIVLSFL